MRPRTPSILASLLLATLLASAPAAHADSSREGWTFGGGLGGGWTTYTLDFELPGLVGSAPRRNEASAGLHGLVGYGLDDRTVIAARISPSLLGYDNAAGDRVVVRTGVAVLSLTKYARRSAPSFYLSGGAGLSWWGFEADTGRSDTWWGLGAQLVVGREIGERLVTEIGLDWARPGGELGGLPFQANALLLHLGVGVRFY